MSGFSQPLSRSREFSTPPEEFTRLAVEAGNAQSAELLTSLIAQVEAMQGRLQASEDARRRLEWRSWVNLAATLVAAVATVIALFLAA